MVDNFGQRLKAVTKELGSICVGIDPHSSELQNWGLQDDLAGLEEFSFQILDACTDRVGVIKPQIAFFERFGSGGIQVLERLLAEAKKRSIITILDVKRGDIGSTMAAYSDAYLKPGAALEVDAITLSPFLGFDSLSPALKYVKEAGKGVYLLALTSNPEGAQIQHATPRSNASLPAGDASIAAMITRQAADFNRSLKESEWGSVGLVVGATIGDGATQAGVELNSFNGTFLSPGFQAQGASVNELKSIFGKSAKKVLISLSRGVSQAGPNLPEIIKVITKFKEEYSLER